MWVVAIVEEEGNENHSFGDVKMQAPHVANVGESLCSKDVKN